MSASTQRMPGEFLLEIGVEEVPDWMIPGALADLDKRFRATLEKFDLGEGVRATVEGTPRRLTLAAGGLKERQTDKEERLTGPPANIAFDAEGKPTKAALGFAARAGVEVAALQTGDDGKLFLERKIEGRPTRDILAEALPEIILGIYFPKTMYWAGKQGPRFIRPIRWVVALFDGEVVDFEIAGVRSGDRTEGHRRLGEKNIRVKNVEQYEKKLRKNYVILSPVERRKRIEDGCEAAFPEGGRRVRTNDKLLRVLTYLTEYPTVIRGDFEETFLELPDEVLETVMLVHQKYFAVEDAETGKLTASFIAVANLDGDPDGEIRRGAVRVLRARFNDAQFFWEQDLAKTLAERVEDLKAVTFQAELGSYFDKAERIRRLTGELARAMGLSDDVARQADRAAELAKCDLTTGMVGEFPELQGVMGGLYAAAQGEPQEVADAIYDHYKPVGAADSIPRGAAGRLVAIADKLDTLGGLYRLGMLPTGSRDPFALRRGAYGIIQILIGGGLAVSLDELVRLADAGDHAKALREFFGDRLRHYLTESGAKYDEINAVLAVSDDEPVDAAARCAAIAEVRPTENFEPLAVSFKRIRNILEKAGGVEAYAAKSLDESALEAGAERDLYAAYLRVSAVVGGLKDSRAYAQALGEIATLRPAVDRFFDDVLVMAEDERVRENRLTFLAQLLREFSTIADFSEIVTAG